MELSNRIWKLGFSNGAKSRQVSIDSGDLISLNEAIHQAKSKLGLADNCQIYSCFEAGRDGFWIHRALESIGIVNYVIDSASIEVNRRQRRAKTDRVDLNSLLRLLLRYLGGEVEVMRTIRIPSPEAEDRRRLHRERERLLKERGRHSARIPALLVTQGIRLRVIGC
jgi:transposase